MELPDIRHVLEQASDGLLYPSESDEPFEAFLWPKSRGETIEDAVQKRNASKGSATMISPDDFFKELADSDDADRFNSLKATLERTLPEFAVIRVGKINVSIYLIGAVADEWVGLKTLSVET